MGCTCGEPNKTELTATRGLMSGSPSGAARINLLPGVALKGSLKPAFYRRLFVCRWFAITHYVCHYLLQVPLASCSRLNSFPQRSDVASRVR